MKTINNGPFKFLCETELEVWRAQTMFTKEPGTIDWLEREVRPGDVFWDVGANIGIYSLFAASLGATVFAFEPHIANAASLLRNVHANKMPDRIEVLTIALHKETYYTRFNYHSAAAGSSGSQLQHQTSENGNEFSPVAGELKHCSRADNLPIAKPNVLKIDVDGNELCILYGATGLLRSDQCRSVQIEVHEKDEAEIHQRMKHDGFHSAIRHDTAAGQHRLAEGADPASVPHNVIFRRGAAWIHIAS